MNQNASTKRCSTALADDRDESAASPSSDSDNPPEPRDPAACMEMNAPPCPPGEAVVEMTCAAEARRIDVPWIRDRLAATLAHINRPVQRLAVAIVGEEQMRTLNGAHRQVNDSTDVLAFENAAPDGAIDADIVVCVDVAAGRASERNIPIEQELLLYALHGVLHCAGFDDQTEEGFTAMHAEEDRILSAIGVGQTFARDPSGHDDDRPSKIVTGDHCID